MQSLAKLSYPVKHLGKQQSAVLSYKKKREIINKNYQKDADAIVGIITMASLDKEMLKFESGLDEIAVLSALASAFGYNQEQPHFVTDILTLKTTVRALQDNINK